MHARSPCKTVLDLATISPPPPGGIHPMYTLPKPAPDNTGNPLQDSVCTAEEHPFQGCPAKTKAAGG